MGDGIVNMRIQGITQCYTACMTIHGILVGDATVCMEIQGPPLGDTTVYMRI